MRHIILLLVFLFAAEPAVENLCANTSSHALAFMVSKKRKKPAKKKKKPVRKKKKKPAPKRKTSKKSSKKGRVRYPF